MNQNQNRSNYKFQVRRNVSTFALAAARSGWHLASITPVSFSADYLSANLKEISDSIIINSNFENEEIVVQTPSREYLDTKAAIYSEKVNTKKR